MNDTLRILFVEDSREDTELAVRELNRSGFTVDYERVESEYKLQKSLKRNWDLVISDFSMPDFDGLRAFGIVNEKAPHIPFIFLSGGFGEEAAVAAMRSGAKDYVLKHNLNRLGAVVQRELDEAYSRQKRLEAEQELTKQQARHELILQSAPVALIELDMTAAAAQLRSREEETLSESDFTRLVQSTSEATRVVFVNHAALNLLNIKDGSVADSTVAETLYPMFEFVWPEIVKTLRTGASLGRREIVIPRPNINQADAMLAYQLLPEDDGCEHIIISLNDITEKNSLERQIRAAQRMEAIGRLAGGIAHDFNNLLTTIGGYTSFLLDAVDPDDEMHEDLLAIKDAAIHAEGLTRHLLAFSRNQEAIPQILNLNETVSGLERLLQRVVGETVEIQTALDDGLGLIELDPTHLEQIIVNLAVNARDAMVDGGRITVETRNVYLEESYDESRPIDVSSGNYIQLTISDNGSGMDEETRLHIFEPFFTTKKEDQGTGLGLSTVYGIVQQAGGFVRVYSEPGVGTTFSIYLPRKMSDGADYEVKVHQPVDLPLGTETVLLVEDDEQLRRIAARMLSKAGYTVLTADDGDTALDACQSHQGEIHAAISDLVLPSLNGRVLAKRLLHCRPEMKILFISGYSESHALHQELLQPGIKFVQKPFSRRDLLDSLRGLIDGDH